jgi:hypothetical protein
MKNTIDRFIFVGQLGAAKKTLTLASSPALPPHRDLKADLAAHP